MIEDFEYEDGVFEFIFPNNKIKIKETFDIEFPDDPDIQLWGGITAVFKSWNGKRAVNYRKIENIPHNYYFKKE